MYMLYVLGAMIEARRGTLVLLALVLVSAVASNLGQYIDTGPNFGGMSGVDYALFGYAWMQSRFNPRGGIFISQYTVFIGILWLVICMSSKAGGDIANTAHLVGLAVGVVSGYVPLLLKR
jgi:GlpG protein